MGVRIAGHTHPAEKSGGALQRQFVSTQWAIMVCRVYVASSLYDPFGKSWEHQALLNLVQLNVVCNLRARLIVDCAPFKSVKLDDLAYMIVSEPGRYRCLL
jgi:hypothetical protein